MVNALQSRFVIENSITTDNTNSNAIDYNAPLSLIDWLNNVNIRYYSTNTYTAYNQYLIEWFAAKDVNKADQTTITTNLYIDLFKNISLNYSTPEEQKFVLNLDYTNPRQLIAVIPFFTKKIKDICTYFEGLRENVKTSNIRQNLRGSKQGIERVLLNDLIVSVTNTDLTNLLKAENVNIENIKSNAIISIQDFYDVSTNYYDLSADIYDSQLFLNFEQAIIDQIKQYPVYINELGTNNFSINLDESGLTLSLLKDKDFINQFNNGDETNLNLNNLVNLVSNNIGTDFYYLSVDSTGTNYVSGLLFKATNKVQNLLNKHFPTTAVIPLTSNLFTNYQIGTYFTPNRQGVSNFYSFNHTYQLSGIKANTVYTFPDPSKYGNISGLTQISFDSPFQFFDDISFTKESKTNTYQWGSIPTNIDLKRFYGYVSKVDTSNTDTLGVEQYIDAEDFFTGDLKNIWSNIDVYPITNTLPISARYFNIHPTTDTLVDQKTDIYGNIIGLFKKITPEVNPIDYLNQAHNTCLFLNNSSFDQSNAYTLITNTSGFTNFTPQAYLISYEFSPQTFCDTPLKLYSISYTGNTFNSINNILWNSGDYGNNQVNVLNGGKFTVNGTDFTSLVQNVNSYPTSTITSSTLTQVMSYVDTLDESTSLYDERYNTVGSAYIRLGNSTLKPLSAAFNKVFSYFGVNGLIENELIYSLKAVDVVEDVYVFSTTSYTVIAPIVYDFTNQEYIPVYGSCYNIAADNAEKLSLPWYSESNNAFFICKLKILPDQIGSNYQIIYPEIYCFKDHQLNKIFPINATYSELSAFSLSNTNFNIYLATFDYPTLSYNSITDTYCISFIAKDPSGMIYPINYYYKYNLDIYNIEPVMFKPVCDCHSENFRSGRISSIMTLFNYNSAGSTVIDLTNGALIIS